MSERHGKTDALHWFDLFDRVVTRRDFLRVGMGASSLVALGALPGCGVGRRVRVDTDPFPFGVASGDPEPDGVVLWTRLSRSALERVGAHLRPVAVRWEVADDEGFSRVSRSGTSDALPELGHSVHVEVEGLEPDRAYFYRMTMADATTPVGRTRTAPLPGTALDRFDFAFASCQHYEHGYFTALRHLSREAVDLVIHLGDYIYEGAATQDGVRRHEGAEPTTLEQYRARYATYRRDRDLQAAHAAAPWICTTDDHEVDNNWAGPRASDGLSPEAFLLRRAAAYQAFYEFMPLRRSSMPMGPHARLYRRLRFGSLVEMNVLDTRQYRSDQACGDGVRPTCPEHVSPGRSLLGTEQRTWLFDGLARSDARWNVLAQQVLMARFRNRNQEGAETWSMDKWDGYPVERDALLGTLADSGVQNPVVLTGDIHSSWVTRLLRDFADERSPAVATEFAGTSLSTGGNGRAMTSWGEAALRHNGHVDFYDSRRGYVRVSVTPDRWTTTLRMVPVVDEPGGPVEDLATFVVESGRAGATPV